MKTELTIDEVKNHFKNAKEVKGLTCGKICNIENPIRDVHVFNRNYWVDYKNDNCMVYNTETDEFAEIISYKSTKEKTPKKELKALLNLAKEYLEKPNSEVCQQWKDKILDACPSLKVESNVMEVGKWYKSFYDNTYALACCETTNGKTGKGYGFTYYKKEFHNNIAIYENFKLATDKEVEELLIAEAKKRGFKNGVHINNSILGFTHNEVHKLGSKMSFDGQWLNIGNNGLAIFGDGKWATISETISLSEAERRLNLKIKIE